MLFVRHQTHKRLAMNEKGDDEVKEKKVREDVSQLENDEVICVSHFFVFCKHCLTINVVL